MKRPTISLFLIAKDEEKNIPQLFASIEGCFDAIEFTDTGSSDKTIETAREWAKKIGCPINIHHFDWVDDFSAARNFAMSKVKTDYGMWIDLDDVLSSKEAFVRFRDDVMGLSDYWMATYHYASDETGRPLCSFGRERIFKMDRGFRWRYFIHEGVIPESQNNLPVKMNYISTWNIVHKRTQDDLAKDKNRNLSMFEKYKGKIDARLLYYWGKELIEAGKPLEAYSKLKEAMASPDLEMHDRIMAHQYASFSAQKCGQPDEAVEIATNALKLDSGMAEFYVTIADCLTQKGKFLEAIPLYHAAKNCINRNTGKIAMPIFTQGDAYGYWPRQMLAKIYANIGDADKALKEAEELNELFPREESKVILSEIKRLKALVFEGKRDLIQTNDIVISCSPNMAYEWDEEIYKTKGMGGSETAALEMAMWLKKLTGLPVKIFNKKEKSFTGESGVEYLKLEQVQTYFTKYRPKVHIAWRHNIKLTDAPTYLWCHDLITPSVDSVQNFDKILCLTPFHKRYVQAIQGIPEKMIHVTRNGIKPERFRDVDLSKKNPNKFVFPSSPDRGLDRAIKVLDKVRETHKDIELHVFYGFENLKKYGLGELASQLEKMISERPWIKYHGFTQQDEMVKHFKEASVWLHPCDFVETFCITALEMLCCKVYPVTRRLGGLMDTLAKAEKRGMAILIDSDCITEGEFQLYYEAVMDAYENKKWEAVNVNPEDFSWESIAKEWISLMGLSKSNLLPLKETIREASL